MQIFKTFQIIKTFKNNKLLTFIEDNKLKIYTDDNYSKCDMKKGYKMNLLNTNKGSYKGSFMNNYICKKFKLNQKLNLVNIETNKILNYCKYFLLSKKEYIHYFPKTIKYKYFWFFRSSKYDITHSFAYVLADGSDAIYISNACISLGFFPFCLKKVKYENNKNF